ncbi:MAG: hypothetical protein WD512_19350, partial [Candidatus Paceibacterota bacterium]
MLYAKYLGYFLVPEILEMEIEGYSSLLKEMSKYISDKSLLILNEIGKEYKMLYKYRNDRFMRRFLENLRSDQMGNLLSLQRKYETNPNFDLRSDQMGKFLRYEKNPDEIVLLVYIPIFVVNVNGCLEEYFLSDSYTKLIKRVAFDLDINKIRIRSWNDLKRVIWEELNLIPNFDQNIDHSNDISGRSNVIKSLFMVLTRAILLIWLRKLICVDGFFSENFELGEDIFATFLGSYNDTTVPEIRHCILTIMMMENQTLFKPMDLIDPMNPNRITSRLSKRIYEDGGMVLGQMCVFYDFMPCGVHLGIIMDGNRRWGKERNLPGHFFGTRK